MKYLIGAIVILTLLMTACYFGEFVQLDDLAEGTNVDAHRTGCDIDREELTAAYMQYEANRHYYPGIDPTPRPTPTPEPVDSTDLATSILLEQMWEHGCHTGRPGRRRCRASYAHGPARSANRVGGADYGFGANPDSHAWTVRRNALPLDTMKMGRGVT